MTLRHGGASLRLSRRLVLIQAAAVAMLVAVCVGTALWVTHKHNRLSADDARQMTEGGLEALEDKLRTVAVGYANWTEAFEAIRARDADWITHNIGSGVTAVGTADLMIVVEPGGDRHYGWVHGMDLTPSSSLLPEATVRAMLRLLADVPLDARRAPTRYAMVDGTPWLLAAVRVRPSDGVPAGVTDAGMPRLLAGFRLGRARLGELGDHHFVDGVRVSEAAAEGRSSLPLTGPAGTPVAHLTWAPPRPGDVILGEIGPALALALAVIGLVTLAASRHALRSARELDAAQAVDRARSAFLANVSHELRTPMNGILGMGQLIKAAEPGPKVASMVDVLLASARSQLELIEDLLDIARIDSGTAELAEEPFDPVETAREVSDLLAPQAAEKNVDLVLEAPEPVGLRALGDRGRFRQILTNLIGNAIKFTDEGAVTVRLEAVARKARLEVGLCVSDTGPGIGHADQERIFERFVQADEDSGRRAAGTGLGLAITRSVVELMGGTLRLDSAPGEGAAFHVALSFPRVSEADADRAPCDETCVAAE